MSPTTLDAPRPADSPDPAPLASLDEWEDFVKARYPEPDVKPGSGPAADVSVMGAGSSAPKVGVHADKKKEEFRDYRAEARASVKEFYRINHQYQTYDFVRAKKAEFLGLKWREMGTWEAMEYLNQLVDDSDPDTDLSQLEHLLQCAEAARRDGRPRWFILTTLVHDLGKILCLRGEPQWAVVGDTFPVGCAHSEKVVYHEFFEANPDSRVPELTTPYGVYREGAGLDTVHMSWGHDEYIYHVMKDYLPDEALYMLRYHSFYAAHRERAYDHLMNDKDRRLFDAVRDFNPYDLYSKSDEAPDAKKLRPFYEELIAEFLPAKLRW